MVQVVIHISRWSSVPPRRSSGRVLYQQVVIRISRQSSMAAYLVIEYESCRRSSISADSLPWCRWSSVSADSLPWCRWSSISADSHPWLHISLSRMNPASGHPYHQDGVLDVYCISRWSSVSADSLPWCKWSFMVRMTDESCK